MRILLDTDFNRNITQVNAPGNGKKKSAERQIFFSKKMNVQFNVHFASEFFEQLVRLLYVSFFCVAEFAAWRSESKLEYVEPAYNTGNKDVYAHKKPIISGF